MPDTPVKPAAKRQYLARVAAFPHRTTPAGRYLRQVRAELLEHLGGQPSATQRRLVERICWLSLRCAQLDTKIASGVGLSEHDSRTYLAWSNSLTRGLREVGHKGAKAAPRSLADHLAASADPATARPLPPRPAAAPKLEPLPRQARQP